ncbi:MAG: hypothetical protein H7A51_18390 [Akkermansiaceae bacterium]|nr:hypothetical protein [Akkermansiaceae bacterium]
MEHRKSWIKLTVAGIASALLFSNCVTSYDSYGRPIQTVDPGAVAVGALALGAVAYAAGHNNGHHHSGHYRRSGHYGGYYGGYRGCR